MILDNISLPIFLISFAIGLFFAYVMGPHMKTIYVYPTPENVNTILFKDKADNCFQFNQVNVECPQDESFLSFVPVQG
jgi:hypothetical protein